MNDRDDFDYEDNDDFDDLPDASRRPVKASPPATTPSEQDDAETDFERRQMAAKRESARRKRRAEKVIRETMLEDEIARKHGADKRALEKQRKRRYNELKKLADTLDIKTTLQAVTSSVGCDCWGPDVAGDKNVPCLGVFVNYLTETPEQPLSPQVQPPRLFGVWLFFARSAKEEITLVVGTKTDDDTGQSDRARPPAQADRVLVLRYRAGDHDQVQSQIKAALLDWQPA